MRNRLGSAPATVMQEHIFGPVLEDDSRRSFANMTAMNRAHILMMESRSIIDTESAKRLLAALASMEAEGPGCVKLTGDLENYYPYFEREVIARAGREAGGQLHTARSRNDLGSSLSRLNVRDSLTEIIGLVLDLEHLLLDMADRWSDQVMTGYTHMQPAQPITFGYYLCAIASAIERDLERLAGAYRRTNECTLGGCAFAGTSYAIDRRMLSESLGFDSFMDNCMDAIASRDYLLEVTSAYTILGSTLSRLAADLYYWASDEFRFVEVDDSLAICSSIMPQKKNPITLEHIRGRSAHLLGAYVSEATVLKGIAYGHATDVGVETMHPYWDAAVQMRSMLVLMTETLSSLKVNGDRMEARVNANYCTITDLADEIVRREGVPFRDAHEIAASIVGEQFPQGVSAIDITGETLDRHAYAHIGKRFGWSDSEVRYALDAFRSVKARTSTGATSEKETRRAVGELRKKLSQHTDRHMANMKRAADALADLKKRADLFK